MEETKRCDPSWAWGATQSPAWHSPPPPPPLLQSHTKNCSTPAEQGRATASHREGVDCGEVWNLLDASHSLPPSRSFEGPLCSPAGLTKLGQGHHWASWAWAAFRRAVRFCAGCCSALHLWWSCVGAGALWAGHFMLPAGNEALQGAAPCDCDSDIRIRNEDTCEVWTLLDW